MDTVPVVEQGNAVSLGEKYNLDGSVKRTHPNKAAGKSSEVYAFRTEGEINAMAGVLDRHIKDAPDGDKKRIAERNKFLFLVSINIGLRASDLRMLKWDFFFNKKGGDLKITYRKSLLKKQGIQSIQSLSLFLYPHH